MIDKILFTICLLIALIVFGALLYAIYDYIVVKNIVKKRKKQIAEKKYNEAIDTWEDWSEKAIKIKTDWLHHKKKGQELAKELEKK
jgi:predicted membrane protein